jgi:hypothetical protein
VLENLIKDNKAVLVDVFPSFFETKEDKSIVDAIHLLGDYSQYLMGENKMLTNYIRDNLEVAKIKEIVRSSQRDKDYRSPSGGKIFAESLEIGPKEIMKKDFDFGKKQIYMPKNKKPIEVTENFVSALKNKILGIDFSNTEKDNNTTQCETQNQDHMPAMMSLNNKATKTM